jgi:hypothetical protein
MTCCGRRGGTAVQCVRAKHVAARERPEGSVRRKWVPPSVDRRALAGLGLRARGNRGGASVRGARRSARGRGRLHLKLAKLCFTAKNSNFRNTSGPSDQQQSCRSPIPLQLW